MIIAKAAHNLTKKYVTVDRSTNDINKVWAAIEIAIRQGLFYTTYTTGTFDQSLKEYLEMNGYNVDYEISGSSIMYAAYVISWEDANVSNSSGSK